MPSRTIVPSPKSLLREALGLAMLCRHVICGAAVIGKVFIVAIWFMTLLTNVMLDKSGRLKTAHLPV
jgi:hypothetical protein